MFTHVVKWNQVNRVVVTPSVKNQNDHKTKCWCLSKMLISCKRKEEYDCEAGYRAIEIGFGSTFRNDHKTKMR